MPIIGNYKVTWDYDPIRNITYCSIRNQQGALITEVKATRDNVISYDKLRVRIITFRKAIKKIIKNNLLPPEDIDTLKQGFRELPNKGLL